MYLWCLRYYLLHYDMQYQRAILSGSWFNLIDSNFEDCKTKKFEWYLKNRKTMGNTSWIRFYIIMPLAILTILLAIIPRICYSFVLVNKTNKDKNYWFELAIYSQCIMLIPFLLLIILYWRIPAFQDSFYIVRELSYLFITLFIYDITSIIFDIYAITKPFYEYNQTTYIIAVFIFNQIKVLLLCKCFICFYTYLVQHVYETYNIQTMAMFICGIIPTAFVMYKCEKIIKSGLILENVTVYNEKLSESRQVQSVPLIKFSIASIENKENKDISLGQCLSHQRGLELFLLHLSSEMSVNFILAFVCFVQYQQFVYDYMKYNDLLELETMSSKHIDVLWFEKIQFYQNIPRSNIVFGNKNNVNFMSMNEKDFKYQIQFKAYNLYKQFIATGSDLQVILSINTTDILHEIIGNMDKFLFNDSIELRDLMHLYSSCCNEIYIKLDESYQRFKDTMQYRKLQQFVFI